mmetsp:Transcript_24051/g.60426  ORF Transcript_24051/g.60426 Transcript_24051/m.60426 type:complete len:215 (-) Transcript_24051:1674-2318(-)
MMMTSEAFLATSVPCIPMANPTSAFLSAGASLVPSPVTATVCRTGPASEAWMPETSMNLSRGVERARTRSVGQILSKADWSMFPSASATAVRNVLPSRTAPRGSLGEMIPHLRAMARAVSMLSPVTILTTMPARWQSAMAPGTSSRRGSSMPTRHTTVRSLSTASASSTSTLAGRSLRAMQRVRSPCLLKWSIAWLSWARTLSSILPSPPSSFM